MEDIAAYRFADCPGIRRMPIRWYLIGSMANKLDSSPEKACSGIPIALFTQRLYEKASGAVL